MAVIRDGLKATQQGRLRRSGIRAGRRGRRSAPAAAPWLISAAMCRAGEISGDRRLPRRRLLRRRHGRIVPRRHHRRGAGLPGAGLFMPAGSAAFKDKGLFRRNVPEFIADLCTGCMECALVCPDAAIPNTVHDIHDLLLTAIRQLDIAETQTRGVARPGPRARRRGARNLSPRQGAEAVPRDRGRGGERARHRQRPCCAAISASSPTLWPRSRSPRRGPSSTRWRRRIPGSGGLFSAAIDPWKCTGCLECVDVCGPHALVEREQDAALLETLQARFEFLSRTPNTPARFIEGAIKPDGDTKRLMLDRNNYYATTGGHGACRGCGEVTAIRLVTGGQPRHPRQRGARSISASSKSLIERLNAKLPSVAEHRARSEAARTHRADDRDSGEAPLSARERPERATAPPAPSSPTRPAAAASTPRPSRSTPTTTRG